MYKSYKYLACIDPIAIAHTHNNETSEKRHYWTRG